MSIWGAKCLLCFISQEFGTFIISFNRFSMLYCLPYMVLYQRLSCLCALFILVYVHECFMYVGLCIHAVPGEAKRGCQMPWKWSHRCLWASKWCWETNLGFLPEQQELSTAESSLQPHYRLLIILHDVLGCYFSNALKKKPFIFYWCLNIAFCPLSLMFPLLSWV